MEQKESLTCYAVATKVSPDPPLEPWSWNISLEMFELRQGQALYLPTDHFIRGSFFSRGAGSFVGFFFSFFLARAMPGEELSCEPSVTTPSSSGGMRASSLKGISVATTMDKYE